MEHGQRVNRKKTINIKKTNDEIANALSENVSKFLLLIFLNLTSMKNRNNVYIIRAQVFMDRAHDTAPEPDGIHYQLLKHLPYDNVNLPLDIYNEI